MSTGHEDLNSRGLPRAAPCGPGAECVPGIPRTGVCFGAMAAAGRLPRAAHAWPVCPRAAPPWSGLGLSDGVAQRSSLFRTIICRIRSATSGRMASTGSSGRQDLTTWPSGLTRYFQKFHRGSLLEESGTTEAGVSVAAFCGDSPFWGSCHGQLEPPSGRHLVTTRPSARSRRGPAASSPHGGHPPAVLCWGTGPRDWQGDRPGTDQRPC